MISTKKLLLTALMLSSAMVLAACGDSDEVTEPVAPEQETQESENTSDASPSGGVEEENIGGGTFGFTEFSVDADYPELDDAVDISYEEDKDRVEAEYSNRFSEQNLSGNDAMDELEPAFQQLEITKDSTDDEAIQQVVEAFGLEDGYTSMEVEVRFEDGTEKEFKAQN